MPRLASAVQTHVPVLAKEVLKLLSPKPGESYLDVTAGYGGHAKLILARTGARARTTLVDRDATAVEALSKDSETKSCKIIHQDYLAASQELARAGEQFDLILADLGMSSLHLNEMNRGFSVRANGPLDMRMDNRQQLTAAEVVNNYSEAKLAEIIKANSDEPKAKLLARLIVQNRPLKTTAELAQLAKQAWPGQSKNHPATRLFQAIRIEVNDELRQLEQALPLWLQLLTQGGRLAIISFHSLEDRLAKEFLADHSGGYDGQLKLLTRKPIIAGTNEIAFNPRSKSAKLRAAAKIKTRSS